MGKYAGKSKLALRPKSTEQVSKVLAYCNDRRLAIVPQVRASSKRAGSTIPNFSPNPMDADWRTVKLAQTCRACQTLFSF